MSDLLADRAGKVLEQSLSGLAKRQRLIAANVANIDTPGYRPLDVKFEDLLRLRTGDESGTRLVSTSPMHMSGTMAPGLSGGDAPSKVDGDHVDPDYEMARLSETVIQYNAVAQLISARLALMRSAITEGRR